MSMPSPTPEPGSPSAEARTLAEIIPRQTLAVIGVTCLAAGVLAPIWGASFPNRFEHAFARFAFALLVAIVLSVGLFILYPVATRMKGIPYLPATVELVGPIAMFVAVLLLMIGLMPDAPPTQGFVFHRMEGPTGPITEDFRTLDVRIIGSDNSFLLVTASDLYAAAGLVMRYNPGQEEVRALVRLGEQRKEESVVFRRDDPAIVRLQLERK
jgi:hypothetical protein